MEVEDANSLLDVSQFLRKPSEMQNGNDTDEESVNDKIRINKN